MFLRNQHALEAAKLKKEEESDDPDVYYISRTEPVVNIDTQENDNKARICPECGKELSSNPSYYVHLKTHSLNKPYRCNLCSAAFSRKPYLNVHMRSHTGEKPFKCQECGKTFTQKSSLNTHKKTHTGLKPFKCSRCEKEFTLKFYLKSHEKTHTSREETILNCSDCNATFNNEKKYLNHTRTHKTSSFRCNACFKSFTRDSYLVRHYKKEHNY